MKKLLFLASALSVLLLASCSNNYEEPAAPEPLLRVPLNGQPTFLVMQNQSSNSFENIKKSSNSIQTITENYIKEKQALGESVYIPRDHKDYKVDMSAIKAYNSNPFKKAMRKKSGNWESDFTLTKDNVEQSEKLSDLDKNFDKNNYDAIIKTFYSEVSTGVTGTDFTENCELYAVGDYCYVWVKNDSKKSYTISPSDATTLAQKFDDIYKQETFIFGSNIPNIKDSAKDSLDDVFITVDPNNTKIHIIVYDLDDDYNKNQNAVLMGYFWSLDFYKNSFLHSAEIGETNCSNECECIHIDSYMLKQNASEIYSTLGHEFQHLLHFVNKQLNTSDGETIQISDTWFNEMMSMVCEDIMLTQLFPNDPLATRHGPQNRLDLFNQTFYAGFITWFDGDAVLTSYANAYAFGAFLLRNFGIDCIKDIASNEYVNELSVLRAVQKKDASIKTFNQLQELFYEVMLYPTSSTKHTLNKAASATYTINSESVTFNCDAINLKNYLSIKRVTDSTLANALYEGVYWEPYYGPFIFTDLFFDLMSWGDPLLETIGPRGTVIVYFDGTKDIEIPHDWSENIKYITVAK